MKTQHAGADDIERFQRGDLPADQVLAIGRHLAECEECALFARRTATAAGAIERLRAALTEEPEAERELPADRRRIFAFALAAAAAIAVIAAALSLRRHEAPPAPRAIARAQPPQSPAGYGRADWDAAVRTTELPLPPVIAALQPRPDALRGQARQLAATVEPEGVVVEETRPRFTWTPVAGARYVVSVFQGSKEVAESEVLDASSWTPAAPFARGADYTWQVEARRGDSVTILPAPPAPPAMFRILDQRTFDDIAAARGRFPNDHLLLGVLYARAGVQREAERELAASNDPRAQPLLRDVRRWRESRE